MQQYLPNNLLNRKYYKPCNNKYEKNLKQVMDNIQKINNQEK